MFTADDGYVDILLSAIYSFLINSNLDNIHVHVITSGFSMESFKRVADVVNSFGVEVKFYPLENFDIEKYNIPSWHGTQIANARLFFADIIKPEEQHIDNLLYLDGDTITVADLTGLTEYKDHTYACKDIGAHYYHNNLGLNTYYNSGVILFDTNSYPKEDVYKSIEQIKKSNTLCYPDQDIFNIALSEQIKPLPISYNLPPHTCLFKDFVSKLYFNPRIRSVSYDEVKAAKEDPKILHTYGLLGIKPWQSALNPFSAEYLTYLSEVSPNFVPKELDGIRKMFVRFPFIFKTILFSRTYVPDKIDESIRKLSLKAHN